jgi:predicted glycoside hydrolase/deacetylase ChbG (UPF0249 family)
MDAYRFLFVVADDFGIGPETSRGILELASRGVVTASVLLSHTPYAAEAVRAWRRAGAPMELGWHPCLTMDPPAAGAARVPSLVGPDGRMWPLVAFLARLAADRFPSHEIERELSAQLDLFIGLTGGPPTVVNSHQHVALFPPVGAVLRRLLRRRVRPTPYLRRLREPLGMLRTVPGARVKRLFLSSLGRIQAGVPGAAAFPGPDWHVGVSDPCSVRDPEFFRRLLARVPGRVVELSCHPGRPDATLDGRDGDGPQPRRLDEFRLLADSSFDDACRRAGFRRAAPSEWRALGTAPRGRAA